MIHKWITSFRSRLSAILDFKFILSVLPPSSVMKWFDNDAKRNQTKFLRVSRKQEKTLIENKRTFSLTVSNTAHSSDLFTFFFLVRFFFIPEHSFQVHRYSNKVWVVNKQSSFCTFMPSVYSHSQEGVWNCIWSEYTSQNILWVFFWQLQCLFCY